MPPKEAPDAGLRSIDHCKLRELLRPFKAASNLLDVYTDKQRLPRWRYYPRELLIPLVRWETTYVALLQQKLRSPALDTYFAMSANLGTHTFFMIFLPILFWCGWTRLGRGYVPLLEKKMGKEESYND